MMRLLDLLRPLSGAVFGAGLASLAEAATPMPRFGPPAIEVLGHEVPLLSALFGLIGVILARRIAPASAAGAKLGRVGNWALTALLAMGVVALVIAGEKRPIVALGWAAGLGYSGLGVIELVARGVRATIRAVVEGFGEAIVKAAGAWSARRGGDA